MDEFFANLQLKSAFESAHIRYCSDKKRGLYAKHIALIWDIYPHLDSVMVIPTTSKPRKESKNVFSVGKIAGLYGNSQTTLLISDMTRVSRKRLQPLNPYQHPKRGSIAIRLPVAWGNRILSGIVTTYANVKTFEETLKYHTQTAMVDNLNILKNHRFDAVQSDHFCPQRNILSYRIWNKDEHYQLQLIQPHMLQCR